MASCREIDPLVTPYIDGEASQLERAAVDAHLQACPPCRERAQAEAAARDTLKSRCCQPSAPEHLRARCRKAATPIGRITSRYSRSSLTMFAAIAVVAGGASLYGLTRWSPSVLAAQLTLDHVKCLALHETDQPMDARAAEAQFAQLSAGQLPQAPEGLQLVGIRRCFCAEGLAVHLMYRYHGEPVSLYVLPEASRPSASTGAFGHDAVIWTTLGTTYVLLGRGSSDGLQRLAMDLK